MKNNKRTGVRVLFYIGGLLIMTLGVAVSVKSDLGVSPVSSIPYTMTCVAGIDLGLGTIIFSAAMVLLQILLLRKQFRIFNLLQLPVGILFGGFLTFCCELVGLLPDPSNMTVKLIMMLISTFIVALGVFMYVPAGFIPLAPEGAMLAISRIAKIKFANVKLAFDISMVAVSCVTCLIVLRQLGSVGIGTITAAVLVGTEVKLLTRFFGERRDNLLGNARWQNDNTAASPLLNIMKKEVYTISEHDSISDAIKLFAEKKVSGCPVTDDGGNVVGFISDGDIIRHLSSEHSLFVNSHSLEKIQFNQALTNIMKKEVSSIAVRKIISVNASDDLDEVCYKLGENHLKKAPVMQDGKMVGIINVSNIVKYAVELMKEV